MKSAIFLANVLQIWMIPHIHTLFEFISIPYENQHQTLNIKKIDWGQIRFRDYWITLLQPISTSEEECIWSIMLQEPWPLHFPSFKGNRHLPTNNFKQDVVVKYYHPPFPPAETKSKMSLTFTCQYTNHRNHLYTIVYQCTKFEVYEVKCSSHTVYSFEFAQSFFRSQRSETDSPTLQFSYIIFYIYFN